MLKRLFDLFFALALLVMISIPFLIVYLAVKLTSKGPVFHMSKRIGKSNQIFLMPKFRSMKINTPQLLPVSTSLA